MEVEQAVANMSVEINYPMAFCGAVLGGIAGMLLWWGFTVITKIAFGLVAVVIGVLVGQGTVRFAGQKRSTGLQELSVGVSVLSFVMATYLVNMSFINQELAKRGATWRVSFPPPSVQVFYRVVAAGFSVMKVVFLAIVVWEAWIIPRPIKLPETPAA